MRLGRPVKPGDDKSRGSFQIACYTATGSSGGDGAVGERDFVRIQRHRHHRVVADQRGELDHADDVPAVEHAPVGRVIDGLPLVQRLRVIVDRERVGIGLRRPLARPDVVDDGWLEARLPRHDLVDVPFELAVAGARRHQDRKLVQARRQRRAVAQELAELLPFVGEVRPVQRGAQRPAQLAARPGTIAS